MALSCTVIRRDCFFLKVSFRSHVQFFSCEIFPVCHLFFLMKSSSPYIDASTLSSMLVNSLPPFLNRYCLSVSPLGCKVLCIIIHFLVLWSICLSLSILIMVLSIFQGGSAQVIIPLMKFLLQTLISRSFLNHLRNSFYFFFHFHSFDGTIYQPLRSGRIWHKVNF